MLAVFITSGWTGRLPLASVMIIWLLLRGLILFSIGIQSDRTSPTDSVLLLVRRVVDLGLDVCL